MSEKSNLFDYESLPARRLSRAVDEETFKPSSFGKTKEETEGTLRNYNRKRPQPVTPQVVEPNVGADQPVTEANKGFKWVVKRGHSLTFVGLFLFTCLVFFRPYEFSPRLLFLSKGAFWVAVFTILVFLVTQLALESRLTARPAEVNLILLLLVTAAFSIPLALDRVRAWQSFSDFVKVVLIFIIMVNVLRTEKRLRTLFLLSLAAGCVLSVAAISDYWTGRLALQGVRIKGVIGGLFDNPNDLALHLVTAIPLAAALFFSSRNVLAKFLYLAVGLLMIAGLVATFSRGGFLGLACASSVMFLRIVKRNKWLLGLLLPCAFIAFIAVSPAGYATRLATTNDGSALARTEDLKRSIYVALHHPLLGIGMNNYTIYSNNGLATHNAYTQVAVEMGFPAMAFYILFIVIPLRHVRRILKETSTNRKKSIYYLAAGLEASLAGYMVSSFFASVAYLWYAYYLVAYAICLRRLYETRSELNAETNSLAA